MTPSTTFTNRMQDAQRAMQQTFSGNNAAASSTLQGFAKSHQDRAARLGAAADALAKAVGTADARVVAMRAEQQRSLRFANGIRTALKRAEALPQPSAGQQAFAGQVQTPDGAAAQGMTVRLTSTVNNVTKKIGGAATNEFGDFALNIQLCDLAVPTGDTPDWALVVEDADGQTLATAPVTVDTSQGVIGFTSLTLGPPAAAQAPPPPVVKPPGRSQKATPKDKDKDKDS